MERNTDLDMLSVIWQRVISCNKVPEYTSTNRTKLLKGLNDLEDFKRKMEEDIISAVKSEDCVEVLSKAYQRIASISKGDCSLSRIILDKLYQQL